jgi:hypothetical protein
LVADRPIRGRVVDTQGKPVVGVLSDNRYFASRPEYDAANDRERQFTAADGTFRVVTIPGPVLLMGAPSD